MRRLVLACILLVSAHVAHAQETVFYKCTDGKGNVSMQNGVPCAAGTKQEVRRIGEVKTVPVPAKKPAVVTRAEFPQPQIGCDGIRPNVAPYFSGKAQLVRVSRTNGALALADHAEVFII